MSNDVAVFGIGRVLDSLALSNNASLRCKLTPQATSGLHLTVFFKLHFTLMNLVNEGMDIDKAGRTGKTPLHLAAELHCGAAVQLLLEKGADIDKADEWGRTPLHAAVRTDSSAVV
jgi:ankyrin repeat protein